MKKAYTYGVAKTNKGTWMMVYHSFGGTLHFEREFKTYEEAFKTATAYNFGKKENTFVEV